VAALNAGLNEFRASPRDRVVLQSGLSPTQRIVLAVALISVVYPFLPPEVQTAIQGEAGLVAAVAAVLAVIKHSS
jgi:hypothetical protein